MPQQTWVINDSLTGLCLSSYSTKLENCQWDVVENALQFQTQALADAAIDSWGDQGGRFFSSNPPNPPHH